MTKQSIAIIGLQALGTQFLVAMVNLKNKGVDVLGVSETKYTEGTKIAEDNGISNLTIEQVVEMGDEVDIIFDLSGNKDIRKELRKTLFSSDNQHTVIAPESVAHLMYAMIDDKPLPTSNSDIRGY